MDYYYFNPVLTNPIPVFQPFEDINMVISKISTSMADFIPLETT